MTYARNNATPRPILVGPIVQIIDGAVQTTGVLVKVSKDGGAFTAGVNTPTVEEGEWSYTPSQGETDCETLRVILYKTGCYSRSQQVVFSASASFGHIGTDQSKIANPTSTVNLSNTSIKTATDVESDIQDIQNRLPAALDGGRLVVTVGAYQTGNAPLQPTVPGRTLDVTANGNAGIDWGNVENQGAIVNLAATSTQSVADAILADVSLDAIGDFFPASFASWTAPLNAAGTASAVWNALLSSYTVAGSFGSRVMRTDNTSAGNGAKVTGAGHVAADIHELQNGVINSNHFVIGAINSDVIATNAIGADELAASGVTKIQTGLALAVNLSALAGKFAGITMLADWLGVIAGKNASPTALSQINATSAGSTYNNATDSLEAIRDRGDAAWTTGGGGGGGGGTVIVSPLSSTGIDRVQGTTIRLFTEEQISHSVDIYDSSGNPVNLAAMTLQLDVATEGKQVLMSLTSGSVNVSGASNNKITFTNNAASSARSGVHYWALRNEADGDRVIAHGLWIVNKTAKVGP